MRTAIIISAGFALWAICLGLTKWLAGGSSSSMTVATVGFIGFWFVAAAVNMWVGVSQAGYAFREEMPIFLLIFLTPAIVAAVVKWRLL
jgi:hypothetical protein